LRLAPPDGVYLTDAERPARERAERQFDDPKTTRSICSRKCAPKIDVAPPPTNARLRELAKTIDRASNAL
jgi:hypothetical protein